MSFIVFNNIDCKTNILPSLVPPICGYTSDAGPLLQTDAWTVVCWTPLRSMLLDYFHCLFWTKTNYFLTLYFYSAAVTTQIIRSLVLKTSCVASFSATKGQVWLWCQFWVTYVWKLLIFSSEKFSGWALGTFDYSVAPGPYFLDYDSETSEQPWPDPWPRHDLNLKDLDWTWTWK